MGHYSSFATWSTATTFISDPKKDWSACDDFFLTIVRCHVLCAAMTVKTLHDTPTGDCLPDDPSSVWMKTDDDRRSIVYRISQQLVSISPMSAVLSRLRMVLPHTLKKFLSLGLFYMNYHDAVKGGDGLRVLSCWKYLLPIFKASDRKNYSTEILQSHYFVFSPRQAHQQIWSRFVNTRGLPGHNIAGDLTWNTSIGL